MSEETNEEEDMVKPPTQRVEPEEDRWLTTTEVAKYLNVSESWVRTKARQLQLPAYRLGGRKLIRFRKSEVDHFVTAQRTDWMAW